MKDTAEYWMTKFKEERDRIARLRIQLTRYEHRIEFLESKYSQKHSMCRDLTTERDIANGKLEILNKVLSGELNND